MTDFHFDKFRTIVADGNISLLSDTALETAGREIASRRGEEAGSYPVEERDATVLKELDDAIAKENEARQEAQAE